MKKVSFYTLGCKLNFTETSTITGQFVNHNFLIENDIHADVFVINTCSVTQNADRECRQIVRRIIKKFPATFIIVVGCYSQLRPEEIAKIPGVDLILGSKEKFDIFKYESEFIKYEEPKIFISENIEDDNIIMTDSTFSGRTRAFLKIQDGCDYKCSYCTVPLARGNSRSVSPENIIQKIKEIAKKGFKEVVLTGVNVSDYGKNVNSNFFSLLNIIDTLKEIPRIRISSIEPNILNDDILNLIANSERICHHFHIPLQSGDNEVLKAMQRRYRIEQFRDLIFKIKEKMPDSGIGFDVIVGFPNENEERFENTYNLLKELPFTYLHVFSYSPRPNTKASSMKNINRSEICDLRSNLLRNLSKSKKTDYYTSQVNKNYKVLVEERIEDNLIFGLSYNYIKIGVPENKKLINNIINVKIKEVKNNYCVGEIVEF